MKLPSRKRLIVLSALLAIAVMSFYLWRDLRLTLDPSKIALPDIVVEDIELDRMIDGNRWHIISPRAEHKGGMLYGDSLDVTITSASGDISKIFAVHGTFSREKNDLTLRTVNGETAQDGKLYTLKSGVAHYDAQAKIWYFSDDVTLFDGKVEVNGPEGYYDTNTGISSVTGGSQMRWGGSDDEIKQPE